MDHIETGNYNSTEFIHSMRNVNRDTHQKNKQNNKKKMKKELKHNKSQDRENIENKGSNIDVVVG